VVVHSAVHNDEFLAPGSLNVVHARI
jgi:hypothetical protein